MDKPIPFWIILVTIVILVSISFLVYFWLKSLIIKDENDNIKRSFTIKQGRIKRN